MIAPIRGIHGSLTILTAKIQGRHGIFMPVVHNFIFINIFSLGKLATKNRADSINK
jgi:hypothetical protein